MIFFDFQIIWDNFNLEGSLKYLYLPKGALNVVSSDDWWVSSQVQ